MTPMQTRRHAAHAQLVELRSVHTDLLLVTDTLLRQELQNLCSVVSLNLDNLAKVLVLHDGTIRIKELLERFQELLVIKFRGDSFNEGQRFPTIPLLQTEICSQNKE
eukprot:GDKK01047866.1.p1 GENE.GDKK01047866.1~~GDKK01047866.1.p1  ORF type:complete len:107 (-),score=1.53 GDKK01047866.1:22-342(-)